MMIERRPAVSADGFGRQAAWALAVGSVVAPFGAAWAAPLVTVVEQGFPATISYGGAQQYAISGVPMEGSPSITGTGTNLIETNAGSSGGISGSSGATKLAAGAVVGPASFTSSMNSALLGAVLTTPYFIGLELQQGTTDTFGFAEIEANPTDYQFLAAGTLVEYAFETTPNTAITAVDAPDSGTAVPEPASLALLALGAAGALAVRRRTATRDLAS